MGESKREEERSKTVGQKRLKARKKCKATHGLAGEETGKKHL